MKLLSPAATALLAEGLVEPAVAPVREYHVRASDGINTYRVFIGAHTAVCTCRAAHDCKHLDAVRAREWASPDELAAMDEALEYRRARERAAGETAMAAL